MVGRVAVVGTLVAVLAAAAAGAEQARFAPRLRAELIRSPEGGPAVVLDVSQTPAEPALGRATFVLPAGQRLRLPPPGATVGEAAVALVPTAGDARTPSILDGPLVTRAPRASACVRKPTAALEAALGARTGAVRRLTIHLLVHERRGTTRITVCLPRQASLAGRAAARRIAIRLLRGLGAPPSGTSVWRGLFTPVGKGGGPAAYPTTTESRGVVVSPSFLTLEGPASARRGRPVRLHGVLSFGHAANGRWVVISSAGTVRVRTHTRASGAYAVHVRAPQQGTLFLQARVRSRRVRCGGRAVDAPAGCTSATLAGVTSNLLRVQTR